MTRPWNYGMSHQRVWSVLMMTIRYGNLILCFFHWFQMFGSTYQWSGFFFCISLAGLRAFRSSLSGQQGSCCHRLVLINWLSRPFVNISLFHWHCRNQGWSVIPLSGVWFWRSSCPWTCFTSYSFCWHLSWHPSQSLTFLFSGVAAWAP